MPELVALVDDFQDNSIDTSLWVTAGTVAEIGGRARLTPGTTFAIWQAVATYDLHDSQIAIEVPVVPPTGSTGTLQCGMVVELDSDYQISIRKLGTSLVTSKKINGVSSDLGFALYNATNHKFWRIRETSGTIFFETSATGFGSYFIQYSINTSTDELFPIGSITTFFYAGYSGVEAAPGTFQIEAVNVPPAMTASGVSTSSGTATLRISHVMSASASSLSGGTAALQLQRFITASAASTSSGSVAFTISSPGPLSITASGVSTSSATASFIILTPGQMTAAGASFSSGSAALYLNNMMSAVGASFATGTAQIVTVPASILPSSQYYIFEPPVALDNPPTLPNPKPRYINAFAKWKGGQRRGRTVLKTGSTYLTVDSPTIDQCNAADATYLGGHVYTVTQTEANSLSAHGYIVTPILTDVTAPILNILAPHPMANVDQIVRVLLTTSEPSALTGTLSTGQTSYALTIPSTAFSIDISELAGGVYRLTLHATDIAGNVTTDYVDINIIHEIPLGNCVYPDDSLYPSDSLFPLACPHARLYPALTTYPSLSVYP